MHIAIEEQKKILIHFERKAQIGVLLFDKILITVITKYSNYFFNRKSSKTFRIHQDK